MVIGFADENTLKTLLCISVAFLFINSVPLSSKRRRRKSVAPKYSVAMETSVFQGGHMFAVQV